MKEELELEKKSILNKYHEMIMKQRFSKYIKFTSTWKFSGKDQPGIYLSNFPCHSVPNESHFMPMLHFYAT